MKDFRPISLENRIIKMISKALLIRLSKVIDTLVAPSQTIFIKERLIFESFAIVSKIINYYKEFKIPSVLL